ncbi:hypothetical protein, partial [Helicobacter burdigaliensis]|uniref:hypothetical protein n=1 Tax=Helicobacter burdigaliensis TaxID=2315334 RepID=UPI0013004912
MQTNTQTKTNLHYSLNQTLKNKVFKSKSHSINTFKNKSSYSFKRTLSISIVASILLSNQLVLARNIDNNTLP